MIIPFNTDAPLYYRPFGTVGLIVLNVVVFLVSLPFPDLVASAMLPHGQGLTPLAWVTSNFVHSGAVHLLGNMIFLWGFGLLVEGKLGWQRFVPLYLLLGAVECALEQVLFWNDQAYSCGASAVIFALMAISLIWAPRNDLTIFYWLGIRAGVAEISIVVFALLTLVKSVLLIALLSADAELLHLLGAAVGAIAGLTLLLTNRVDCEGWDLLSVLTGRVPTGESSFSYTYRNDTARRQRHRQARRRRSDPAPRQQVATSTVPSRRRFSQLVQQRKVSAACAELHRIRHLHPEFQPQPSELLALARGLRQMKHWEDSVQMYQQLLEQRPDFSLARVELAEILVLVQTRPSAARRILEPCDPEELSPRQVDKFHALQTRIQSQIDSGVIELEGQAW